MAEGSGVLQNINFIFLVVGHTKNAANSLFYSLKHKYCQQNIFMMEQLLERLNVSASITVVLTVHNDFSNYDKFFTGIYIDVSKKIISITSSHAAAMIYWQ